ncbi:GGDEF domain-containing protein [Kineococcus gynurae]|uniref:GGDEF domain-containing protein n=1 Tax=Kineococcus gynurae TaxID=452979 RepID=A0ABV5LRT6_9ACTN
MRLDRRPRRWFPARPGIYQVLVAVVVALGLACAGLILTSPRPAAGNPVDDLAQIFIEDVEHAPTPQQLAERPSLVPLDEQLRIDADKLLDAGVVTSVRITRDGAEVVAPPARARDARTRPRDLPEKTISAPTVDGSPGAVYRIRLTVADPADLASLRWRRPVLQALVAAMLLLMLTGLVLSRRAHARQERLSLVDPLTGVGNRRQLDRLATRLLRDPRPGASRHTLLLLDLDHFKQLNDRFGHAHGDDALRRLADALLRTLRPHDHVVRLGGDEFAVLLCDVPAPPADHALGRQILDRVRARLPDLGVSGGCATWPDEAADLDGLMDRADRAMYADKERRRRTVDVRTAPDRVG